MKKSVWVVLMIALGLLVGTLVGVLTDPPCAVFHDNGECMIEGGK